MNANCHRFERHIGEDRAFDEREGCGMRYEGGPCGGFEANRGDPERGFHCGPRTAPRPGMGPHGMGPGGPGFGPHGMPPHGMPPHGFGPRGMGPGCPGMPPRRPSREFLQRRVEEADLAELIDMAGRMLRRRPQGSPAQGQALILSILAGREALSQRDLQMMLGIQPGSLSELVSKLEIKGLLTREKAADRRGNLLRITDAGRQALAAQPDADPADDPFAPLSPEQQDQLSAMLRALLDQWISELDDAPRPPCGQRPVEV